MTKPSSMGSSAVGSRQVAAATDDEEEDDGVVKELDDDNDQWRAALVGLSGLMTTKAAGLFVPRLELLLAS